MTLPTLTPEALVERDHALDAGTEPPCRALTCAWLRVGALVWGVDDCLGLPPVVGWGVVRHIGNICRVRGCFLSCVYWPYYPHELEVLP